MSNLAGLLEDSAARYPDRVAIVFPGQAGDTRLTYAQVNGAANQVANLLVSRGIQPGDKVALSCPNLPYFTIVYFGILKAGATVVPLIVLVKGREQSYHLDDSDSKAYFCFQGTPELPIGAEGKAGFDQTDGCEHFFVITADPAAESPIEGAETMGRAMAQQPPTFDTVETDDDDTAVILYTSGTTGQPKGAELRHRNMRDNALIGKELFGADAERPDTYLCVLPLFHSFGQTVIQNGAFAFGGTVVMLPRFEAGAALALMDREEVTFFAGVPTMYWGLLGALADSQVDVDKIARNLRIAAAGGSALPVEVHKDFDKRFGVTIQGHNIMKGYYGRPDATEQAIQDGWFRSGDLARRDEDGWYYIVDRSKDMIIRGGFNVYPREVEEVLMTHPDVSLAAVVGVPHESLGEEVKAFVILNPDAKTTPEELVEWSRQEMAAYKYPREVVIVDSLPMTATGKILKRELV